MATFKHSVYVIIPCSCTPFIITSIRLFIPIIVSLWHLREAGTHWRCESQAGILVSHASTYRRALAAVYLKKLSMSECRIDCTHGFQLKIELRFDINEEKWRFIQQDFYLFYFIIFACGGEIFEKPNDELIGKRDFPDDAHAKPINC